VISFLSSTIFIPSLWLIDNRSPAPHMNEDASAAAASRRSVMYDNQYARLTHQSMTSYADTSQFSSQNTDITVNHQITILFQQLLTAIAIESSVGNLSTNLLPAFSSDSLSGRTRHITLILHSSAPAILSPVPRLP